MWLYMFQIATSADWVGDYNFGNVHPTGEHMKS